MAKRRLITFVGAFSRPCAVALMVLVLVATGCASASAPSPGSIRSDGAAAQGAAEDVSLSARDYIARGLPAPDRIWLGNDVETAANVLATLAEQGHGQLPRAGSARSGEVFTRMTSADNLAYYRDRTLPLNARLPLALTHLQAGSQLLKLYLAQFLTNDVRDTEMFGNACRGLGIPRCWSRGANIG
jgi:hypothetical protein